MASFLSKEGLDYFYQKLNSKFSTIATAVDLLSKIELKADKTAVDAQIANLVNSAPETLNTLNELAAALGDDPNFATTITTEIGKKVSSSEYNEAITGINTSIASITPEKIGALPITGGEVSGTVAFYNSAMSIRHAEIKDGTFRFRQTNPTDGWSPSLQLRKSDDSAILGAYGFLKGAGDTLDYYYIGNTSVSPLFKMIPDGTISLATALPIASGGTGATDAATARANLGAYSQKGGVLNGSLEFELTTDSMKQIVFKRTTDDGTSHKGFLRVETGGVPSFFYRINDETVNHLYLHSNKTELGQPLTISSGGTGAIDAATARSNLGITPANIGAATAAQFTSLSSLVGSTAVSTQISNYAPSKTGSGASGSWGISVTGSSASCTGNAATATKATQDASGNIITSTYATIATVNGKAPTSHASTATTYGAASASNYGHAMASSTTPKANGTAAVGSETAKFARGDHVHPLQTSVSGSAGSVAWSGVTSKPSYYDAKAIKGITRSGTTFTYTCMDGTTGTFTQQDNNTTYSAATTSADGLMSATDKSNLDRVKTLVGDVSVSEQIDLSISSLQRQVPVVIYSSEQPEYQEGAIWLKPI